jgi:hypothetical protein
LKEGVTEKKKFRWSAAILVTVGYVLSPLSWWNDALINIPLAWLMASAMTRVAPLSFDAAMLIAYWLTNLAGFFLMYLGGKKLSPDRPWKLRDTIIFIALSLVYTLAIYLLTHYHVVKPMF